MEALNESHSEEFKECQSALVDRREEMETTAYDVLQIVEKLHENKTEPLIHSLPGKEAVDKILRYETAIERPLYKAMSELDRLQGRRRGEVAPPTINVNVSRE